eukprot:1627773-Pyramimonas_sp.AAC.1
MLRLRGGGPASLLTGICPRAACPLFGTHVPAEDSRDRCRGCGQPFGMPPAGAPPGLQGADPPQMSSPIAPAMAAVPLPPGPPAPGHGNTGSAAAADAAAAGLDAPPQ